MREYFSLIGSQIFIFGLIWWLVLFTTLPLGVTHAAKPEPGHDPGAPIQHRMKRKAILTTIISFVIWGIYFTLTKIAGYSLWDLPI